MARTSPVGWLDVLNRIREEREKPCERHVYRPPLGFGVRCTECGHSLLAPCHGGSARL